MPKYDHGLQDEGQNERLFNDVEEATRFWKSLWETQGTGHTLALWRDEIRSAIRDSVPEMMEEDFELSVDQAARVISKKLNWSAPGPDRLVKFWWKRASSVHVEVTKSFQTIVNGDQEIPRWTTEGKKTLISKPGEFSSENQRPITCLNSIYKRLTSCLIKPVDQHLDKYGLMQGEQRGAREGCSGTMGNLLIDGMVCQDCQRGRRNLSMAWVDIRKAYDSVDHSWLQEMFLLHRFPRWTGSVISRLSAKWNTRINVKKKHGVEISERIRFNKGLPQGDALCPCLFTLCLNPVAWKLRESEGYRLSKPISAKITNLLYIDDLKVYAASEGKLGRVMVGVRNEMEDIGLHWNERKCATVHVKRGQLEDSGEMRMGEASQINSLKDGVRYKFLGVLENIRQEDNLVLENA